MLLGSHSGQLKQWDVAASAPVALPDLEGHTDVVYSVKVSTSMVLSGSMDETVRLRDLRTGRCVRTMEGHLDAVVSVDMDEHCRSAVSGSMDQQVRVWDLGSGRCSATLEGHPDSAVRDVVMHDSGSSFLSSGWNDFTVNSWAVGSSQASIKGDMRALSPGGKGCCSRLFASRNLSSVAYCCLNKGGTKLEFRLWR